MGALGGVHSVELHIEGLGTVGGIDGLAADDRRLGADKGQMAGLETVLSQSRVRALVLGVPLAETILADGDELDIPN